MKNQLLGFDYLVVQDEFNTAIGLLNAANEIEPALLKCMAHYYNCEAIQIKGEEPDGDYICYFTFQLNEEDGERLIEVSVTPVWLHETEEEQEVKDVFNSLASFNKQFNEIMMQGTGAYIRTGVIDAAADTHEIIEEHPMDNTLQPDTEITFEFGNNESKHYICPNPLTVEYLEANRGKIFATGKTINRFLHSGQVRWIAKVGDGFNDWAIYYDLPHKNNVQIAREGEKTTTEAVIRELVPCTDEAFKLYRK